MVELDNVLKYINEDVKQLSQQNIANKITLLDFFLFLRNESVSERHEVFNGVFCSLVSIYFYPIS